MKVTAAIFRNGDKVLLMRRAADQPLAGEWEYPGGKFEDGEDGPTCLHRELAEELGIDAQIGNLITIANPSVALSCRRMGLLGLREQFFHQTYKGVLLHRI